MKIGVVLYGNHLGKGELFNLEHTVLNYSCNNVNLVNVLRKQYFEKCGYEYNTLDMYDTIDEVDYIIVDGYDKKLWMKAFFGSYSDKVIYYAVEPPAVDIMSSQKGIKILLNAWRYIITWPDEMVDNKRVFKTSPGFCFNKIRNENIKWKDKNLLVAIVGCKTSNHPEELYSERLKVIHHFENKRFSSFELYGILWEKMNLQCYKGSCENKAAVYHKFKFALCLENQSTSTLTEKIFDCFVAGIVPIYMMSPDKEKYIPKNTYIEYSQFKSLDEMEAFLNNMSYEEYKKYHIAIDEFLESKNKDIFEPEFYCKQIIKIIEKDKKSPYRLALYKKIFFLFFICFTTLLGKLKIKWKKLFY